MDAVIGGTHITSLPNLTSVRTEKLTTPYGDPSSAVSIGLIGGREIAFLPRHGDPHALAPHKINYRANLWALQELGVTQVVSIATCGGIRGDFGPGVLVLPDQIIDYSHGRIGTYHDGTDGKPVRHVDFTQPYSDALRRRSLPGKASPTVAAMAAATGQGWRPRPRWQSWRGMAAIWSARPACLKLRWRASWALPMPLYARS